MHRDGKKEAAREREIHALTLFSSSVPTSSFYLGVTKRESGGSLRLDSREEEGACVPAKERERESYDQLELSTLSFLPSPPSK